MWNSKRLVLAHLWFAFAGFGLALVLGEWQMLVRSPLHAWISDPEWYYRSVTAHGTTMAYVFPTLVAMGFGYFVTEKSLSRPLVGLSWAWIGFALVVIGTVAAIVPVALGLASVLYTFYPPLIGNPFYYIGIVLVVVGSWVWVALMSVNLYRWKRDNPGAPVPFAMFATVAGSYLWGWTAVGAALELLFQIIPVSLGLSDTIDAGLARVFFSWTLHAIVYFWLMPTYIAYYTIVPRAIGGRLFSDSMGRIAFILFLIVAMPIGIHHAFEDPQVGAGFKYLHSVFTAFVALPTLLTVFTICASVEIAGRLRGGKGVLGWLRALPWRNPVMLGVPNPGSQMYHSHHNAAKQVGMGLLGAFIVEPKDSSREPKVDVDYVMILNDMAGYTLNGKSFPATEPIVAKLGQTVRIRFMNEGMQIHPMHLHGVHMTVIAKDGWEQPAPWKCDTLNIAPGERWDVLVKATNPGTWAFHCHILPHAESEHGMFGMVTALIVK